MIAAAALSPAEPTGQVLDPDHAADFGHGAPLGELQTAILQDQDERPMAIGSARLDRGVNPAQARGRFWVRRWELLSTARVRPTSLLLWDGRSVSLAQWQPSPVGVSQHFDFSWQ